jgi:hypothetical protein
MTLEELRKSLGNNITEDYYGHITVLGTLQTIETHIDFYGAEYAICTFSNIDPKTGKNFKKEVYGFHAKNFYYTYGKEA